MISVRSVVNSWKALIALVAVSAIAAPAGSAQSVTSTDVRGTVRDTADIPIEDAIVTLVDDLTGVVRTAETDGDGWFAFPLVPAGSYRLTAEQLGYRPVHLSGIEAGPGSRVAVPIVLPRAEPPVTTIDTVGFRSVPTRAGSGVTLGIPGEAPDRLPVEGRGVTEALRFSSAGDFETSLDGLGIGRSTFAIDGLVYRPPAHRVLPQESADGLLPLLSVQTVDLLTSPTDLEWDGFAGVVVHGVTARGTRDLETRVYGDVSGGPGVGSQYFDAGAASPSSFRGGLRLSGPIIRDTAHFVIGADVERSEVARPRVWVRAGSDSTLLAAASDSFGVDLAPYSSERAVERQRASVFGRFDWSLAERHRVSVWGAYANTRAGEPAVGPGSAVGEGTMLEGSDFAARGSVTSGFSERVGNEFRLGFDQGVRDYIGGALPATRIASLAAALGTDEALPGRFQRTAVSLEDALQFTFGTSRLKVGLAASLVSFDQQYGYGMSGSYWYSGVNDFAAGTGIFRGVAGTTSGSTFSTLGLGAFIQNTWSLVSGLDVTVGLRYGGRTLPQGEIVRNADWLTATGILNDSIDGYHQRLMPRFGFVWRVDDAGSWQVRGNVGTYSDELDPAVFGELIGETGRTTVQYAAGDVGGWPSATAPGAVTDLGARLTLLGPDFETPRSAKAAFGIAHMFSGGGTVAVDARFRHTDFLTRRHDLNLLSGPSGYDQNERPVYGTLQQMGALIVPGAESNRRFSGFDMVSALDVDGYSDYWAITARLRHPVGRFLGLTASYTYSQTRDNVLSGGYGGPYAQLNPFPEGLNGKDWTEGISDFDVPHRLSIGVEMKPMGRDGLTLAGVYRYRSGLPFTPGFRDGVDVNGDGSGSNDPAYVDDGLTGMDDILAGWACLRGSQIGSFAERNVCRDPSVDRLDLRVGLGPLQLGSYPIELWIEMLNATDSRTAVYDHALYLVDPAQSLTTDAMGVTTIPLLVNDGFGQAIAERSEGRMVRVGLRVNY